MRINKKAAALAVAAVTVAGVGTAYAYWTTTGTGDGTATTNSAHSASLTVTTVSNFAPGLTKKVPFSFTNAAGNCNQNYGVASVATVSDADITSVDSAHPCTAALLNLAYAPGGSAVGTVNDGGSYTSVAGTQPSLTMTDTGTSQDLCQGASVKITVNLAQGS